MDKTVVEPVTGLKDETLVPKLVLMLVSVRGVVDSADCSVLPEETVEPVAEDA